MKQGLIGQQFGDVILRTLNLGDGWIAVSELRMCLFLVRLDC